MKNGILIVALILAGVTSPAWAKSHKKLKGFSSDELTWVPNPERPEEVQVAVVWGDIKKAHSAFHKFKPGFDMEMHGHSANFKEVVVAGIFSTGPEDDAKKYGPGSFIYHPAGSFHVTRCVSTTECIVYVESSSGFDVIMPKKSKK